MKLFKMIRPCGGTITNPFGGGHTGLDIAAPSGTDAVSAEDGTVSAQLGGPGIGYGYYREVSHGTLYVELVDPATTYYRSAAVLTRYCHVVNNSSTPAGGPLDQGGFVADVDCTGTNTRCDHLHFEVREGTTPVDPETYLP